MQKVCFAMFFFVIQFIFLNTNLTQTSFEDQIIMFLRKSMLPRKVDWSILAQCDSFAVKKLVETLERPAMHSIQTLRESSFERKLSSDCRFRETFEAICLAYTKLEPSFKIRYDNYGDYRLLYEGTEIVWPPAIVKRNPLDFVTPVPDGGVTDL